MLWIRACLRLLGGNRYLLGRLLRGVHQVFGAERVLCPIGVPHVL